MKIIYITLIILILCTACSSADHSEESSSRPDFDQIPEFEPQELFSISTFGEGDFFGFISSINIDSSESILVSDPSNQKIHVFDKDGTYLNFIGGDGEGPGEFRRLASVSFIAPDTLHAVDRSLNRISFFSKSDESWELLHTLDTPESSLGFGSEIVFSFSSLYPHKDGYLARFTNMMTIADTANHSFAYYKLLDEQLNLLNENKYLFELTSTPLLHRDSGSMSVSPLPESHRMLFSNTVDGVKISTWSGDNLISIRQITGNDSTGFRFPSKYEPYTDQEIEAIINRIIPDPSNSIFSRTALRDLIPEHKDYSLQLLVDDKGRIWILTRPLLEDDPEWLIFDQQGTLLAAMHHPGGRLAHIKNNRIYVIHSEVDTEPFFSVYKFSEE